MPLIKIIFLNWDLWIYSKLEWIFDISLIAFLKFFNKLSFQSVKMKKLFFVFFFDDIYFVLFIYALFVFDL